MELIYKTVEGKLPWCDKTKWKFPSSDTRLKKSFIEGPNDIDASVSMLLPLLKGRRTCIQAGGCLGFWPIRLSQIFEQVITFEPEPSNYECLMKNIEGIKNITAINAALGCDNNKIDMILPEHETGNSGAYYVKQNGRIDTVIIDELKIDDVDLIYLDIEGSERNAIIGAKDTIDRYSPVIGLEDKKLHERYDEQSASELLQSDYSYKVHGRPFKLDVILTRD
jgi:FkbM family methyltransferase